MTADGAKRHLHIGFVSTRFAGTDGVSLETAKWAEVLERLGHRCFYFAGVSDRPQERTQVVPEAFFGHAAINAINRGAFEDEHPASEGSGPGGPEGSDLYDMYRLSISRRFRTFAMTGQIDALRDALKQSLYAFMAKFALDLLIAENALSLPMNIPLGLALTEFIAETGAPVIAHHHDFYWERQRFLVNCVGDYLRMAFPPDLPSIRHVVINSLAARELALRTGIAATIIPNVMDFDQPPGPPDACTADVREALGVTGDGLMFLQPTRVVQRKGIEHAIELTKRVGMGAKLVISHASGDEGHSYEKRVREYAALLGVPVNFEADIIRDKRGLSADGRRVYTLMDVYPAADLVTYPSTAEGFGNAFLEAVYFRRPLVVNNYSIFDVDIKPLGFRVIEFEGYITDETVGHVHQVLTDRQLAAEMVETNYRLARRYFSYNVLGRRLLTLLAELFGEDDTALWSAG